METPVVTETTVAGFPAAQVDGDRSRPPLLFIHGSFVQHQSFAGWQRHFGALGWRSVAASGRGRAGVGPDRAKGLGIADYVNDTLAVIAAMDQVPIVVGHSLGGLIAQKIAELGRARAAVLLCSAPAAMLTAQRVALPTYLPMIPRILTGQPIIPAPNGCSTIALNAMPEAARPAIHRTLVHESGKVYREMIFGSYKIDFGRIKCPVLVAGGRLDRIVEPKLVEWTAAKLGVMAKLYVGHAHWLLEEPGWEAIAGDVAAFLDRTCSEANGKVRRLA